MKSGGPSSTCYYRLTGAIRYLGYFNVVKKKVWFYFPIMEQKCNCGKIKPHFSFNFIEVTKLAY